MRRRLLPAVLVVMSLSACAQGGTGIGVDLVSQDQVETMGAEAWSSLRAETPVSRDAALRQRAERVAGKVLAASGENPEKWEVVVFDSPEPNAFALPGGKIGVYTGMMALASDDAELAAVLGHEVAHNQAQHGRQRANSAMATELGVNLASAALGAAGVADPQAAATLLGVGAQYGMILPYSRNQELEADRLGLTAMAKAGYDPEASIRLWQKMAQQGARAPGFLSTHPEPEQRIAQLRGLMPQAKAVYQRGG